MTMYAPFFLKCTLPDLASIDVNIEQCEYAVLLLSHAAGSGW
jgi:hypothetical protein